MIEKDNTNLDKEGKANKNNKNNKNKSEDGDRQEIFSEDKIKKALRRKYGSIAEDRRKSCCGDGSESRRLEQSTTDSCCGADSANSTANSSSAAAEQVSNKVEQASYSYEEEQASYEEQLGYDPEKLDEVIAEANYGLGCGNPGAIASLKPGETVLDLGCGAGFDLLLAAREVGPEGRLIGVDMTPEMIEKARKNAVKNGLENAEFHLAEIENLPLEDSSVDVIMSNCVINLVPDKKAVYREAYRVLKPGGRLAISDVVKKREFPQEIREDLESYLGCVAGAITRQELDNILQELNYQEIEIKHKDNSVEIVDSWSPESQEMEKGEGDQRDSTTEKVKEEPEENTGQTDSAGSLETSGSSHFAESEGFDEPEKFDGSTRPKDSAGTKGSVGSEGFEGSKSFVGSDGSEEIKFSDYIYSAYISAVKPEPEARFSSADFARLSRALGNQHRIEILQLLADQPAGDRCMVGNIVDELPISQSTVSQHLKVLKQAGWITGQVEGPSTCYCIDRQTIKKYRKMFKVFLEG